MASLYLLPVSVAVEETPEALVGCGGFAVARGGSGGVAARADAPAGLFWVGCGVGGGG